jgi:general secretion pathway protein B
MSLILDALKKSEAERRRGLPPGLGTSFGAPRRRVARAPWVAGASAVVLAAGLAGGWMWLRSARDEAPPDLASNPATPAPVDITGLKTTPAPTLEPTTLGAEAKQLAVNVDASAEAPREAFGGLAGGSNGGSVSGGGLPVPQRAVLFTPSATPGPQMVQAEPPAPPVSGKPAAVEVQPPTEVAQKLPETATAMTPPPTATSPETQVAMVEPAPVDVPPQVPPKAEPQETLLTIYQLPYGVRKDLPKLALSMHVYSPVREERFIVLNGKRFSLDSPPPGPDLSLLDILDDGAVFEFRGQRFLLPRTSY